MAQFIKIMVWIIFIFSNEVSSKTWNFRENPILNVSKTLNTNLDSLPSSSEISSFMGNNWIWPLKEGFIANRWSLQNTKNKKEKRDYKLLKKSGLSNIDLTQLSPSEKLDLILGNKNWKFTKFLKTNLKKFKNGGLYLELAFAETSLQFSDQKPLSLKTDSGLIPIGSSDFKAILSANYFLNHARKAKFLGEICLENFAKINSLKKKYSELELNQIINSSKCSGLNPGAFHVMLSNFLGEKDQGISLDLARDRKLKVRPIIGYISNIKKKRKDLVSVTTFLKYLEPSRPHWLNSLPGERGYTIFKYDLELDKLGNIVGGTWTSANRVDFIVIPKKINLQGVFTKIKGNIDRNEIFKNKTITQKLILKDLLNRVSKREKVPKSTIDGLLTEYSKASLEYYRRKKAIKKNFRKINTREVDTEREILLKRLEKHKIQGKLQKIHQGIVETATMKSGNIFKKFLLIRSLNNKFLDKARVNSEGNDLRVLGQMVFIQKKLINNYFKKSIDKRVDIDSLYLKYLMEDSLYKRKYVLTKSKDFLTQSKTFLSGLQEEADFFKLNRRGRIFPKKGSALDGKIQSLKKGEPSAFKKLSKKIILKNKVSNTKGWKEFVKPGPKRTIASIEEISPEEDLINYLNFSLDQKELKNAYTTNLFKISMFQRKGKKAKKLTSQKQINSKLKQDILNEISVEKKTLNFDYYLLNSFRENIRLMQAPLYSDQKLEKVRLELLNDYQKNLDKSRDLNHRFLNAIMTGGQKSFNKLLKLSPSLIYQNEAGDNAIMTAAKYGREAMLQKLIRKNKKLVNLENPKGQNALFLTVINENKIDENTRLEIIKSLLNAGINKNVRDRMGKTPKDYIPDSGAMEAKLENLLQ
jgi:hypothetical protein